MKKRGFPHHLYRPVKSEKIAGIQTKGSKAERKSAFIGFLPSRVLTTPQYDAPQNTTRTTKAEETKLAQKKTLVCATITAYNPKTTMRKFIITLIR